MPRKPNYSFEKRQRELAKAEKKAARLEAQARKRERKSCDGENQAGESTPATDDMPDILTPEARSKLMSRIRGTDTKPELFVRRVIRRGDWTPIGVLRH